MCDGNEGKRNRLKVMLANKVCIICVKFVQRGCVILRPEKDSFIIFDLLQKTGGTGQALMNTE